MSMLAPIQLQACSLIEGAHKSALTILDASHLVFMITIGLLSAEPLTGEIHRLPITAGVPVS